MSTANSSSAVWLPPLVTLARRATFDATRTEAGPDSDTAGSVVAGVCATLA